MGLLSREKYDALLAAYRVQDAPNHTAAARVAGCDRKTARGAWGRGAGHLKLAPIKARLDAERAGRREKLAAEDANKRALQNLAHQDAETVQLKEAALSRAVADLALHGARPVAVELYRFGLRLSAELKSRDPASMSTADLLKASGAVARVSSRFADLVRDALQIERLRLGDPTSVSKVQHELVNATPEQAATMATQVLATATRLQHLQAAEQKTEEPSEGGDKLLN